MIAANRGIVNNRSALAARCFALLLAASLPWTLAAQTPIYTAGIQAKKLAPAGVALDAGYGEAVAVDGNFLAVGAAGDDDEASDAGAAYVYERHLSGGSAWGLAGKLTADDAAVDDGFGPVAISQTLLAVGAPGNASSRGAVYIFQREPGASGDWLQIRKIVASDGAAAHLFGSSVALQGDILLAGAPGADGKGAAYVFQRNSGGDENWGELKKLVAGAGAAGDEFGASVALDDGIVLVGAPSEDSSAADAGAAYVFRRHQGGAGVWGLSKRLVDAGLDASAGFGTAVAIDGDHALVGAPAEDTQGAAFVFRRGQGGADNWGSVRKLLGGAAATEFGRAVALQGTRALVSRVGDDVQLFRRHVGGENAWGLEGSYTSAPFLSDARDLGLALAADGMRIAMGASGGATPDEPHVVLFTPEPCISAAFTEIASTDATDLGTGWGAAAIADFDGDGREDVMTARGGGSSPAVLAVYRGDGAGGFGPPVITPVPVLQATAPGNLSETLATADFNLDGHRDVAVQANDGVIAVGLGDGALNFSVTSLDPGVIRDRGIAVGDFNVDGIPDLAVPGGPFLTVWLGDGEGAFSAQTLSAFSPPSIQTADFDQDGRPDFASLFLTEFWVLFGGQTATPSRWLGGSRLKSVGVGDLDSDGYSDALLAESTGETVKVLINGMTEASWSISSGLTLGRSPVGLAATDFNLDGRTDYGYKSGERILPPPSGGFQSETSALVGSGEASFSYEQALLGIGGRLVGDVNDDGRPDLFGNNSSSVRTALNSCPINLTFEPIATRVVTTERLKYDVAVRNIFAESTLSTAELSASLPPDSTFVSATTDTGSCVDGLSPECDLGDLSPGQAASLQFEVDAGPPGEVFATVSVSAISGVLGEGVFQVSASAATRVLDPTVTLTISASPQGYEPDQDVTFTLAVGNSAASVAEQALIRFFPPAGMILQSAMIEGQPCTGTDPAGLFGRRSPAIFLRHSNDRLSRSRGVGRNDNGVGGSGGERRRETQQISRVDSAGIDGPRTHDNAVLAGEVQEWPGFQRIAEGPKYRRERCRIGRGAVSGTRRNDGPVRFDVGRALHGYDRACLLGDDHRSIQFGFRGHRSAAASWVDGVLFASCRRGGIERTYSDGHARPLAARALLLRRSAAADHSFRGLRDGVQSCRGSIVLDGPDSVGSRLPRARFRPRWGHRPGNALSSGLQRSASGYRRRCADLHRHRQSRRQRRRSCS